MAWPSRDFVSQSGLICGVALVSGALVAGVILATQSIQQQAAKEATKDRDRDGQFVELIEDACKSRGDGLPTNKEDERSAALAKRALQGEYDEELIREQLTRTSSFLTPAGLSKLRSAFVVVVGLGGVGSHCTAALARSGVSRIRLIDFDQVTLSSLNRHALAVLADVGTPKVVCVRKRLQAVVPWIAWECHNEIWKADQAARLLGPWTGEEGRGRGGGGGGGGGGEEEEEGGQQLKRPDYVIDAIDNIDSKVALLRYCRENGLQVLSSMGAGCKSDPTRIMIGDISTSLEDPLSRATRRRLKLLGINDGILVCYSTEKTGPGKATLLPLAEDELQRGSVGELGVLPDFRARILPVLGTMPAAFGYAMANHCILEMAGYPHEVLGSRSRERAVETVLNQVQASEERLARWAGADGHGLRVAVSREDVGFLLEEVFRGKSVVSGLTTRLTLVRWRRPEGGEGNPSSSRKSGSSSSRSSSSVYEPEERYERQKSSRLRPQDLVCMTREEATFHEQEVLTIGGKRPEEVYAVEVVELVEKRLRNEAELEMLR